MKFRRMVLVPEIPTSSMADIAFLLIVFFMLTTVFSANKGMTHILPADADKVPYATNPAIFLQVFPSGDFKLDGTAFTFDQVEGISDHLAAIWQVNSQKPVILLTDLEAAYGLMVGVLNEIKMAANSMQIQDPGFALDLTLPNRFEREIYQQMAH